jgi:alkyl hydroperoxide reductase 1
MVLKAGDKFPEGVKFGWAPILDEDPTVCGIPQLYDANKEWAGKKVVIVAVPGKSTQTTFNLTMCESLSHIQL